MTWEAVSRRVLRWRAVLVTRRAALRRTLALRRDTLVPAALVTVGVGGWLLGAALVGEWCLGLAMMAAAAAVVWVGLNRDDGAPLPRRGERTVAEILEEQRRLP